MSKNTNSTQFRSVDVDVYDEDQYQDESKEDVSASVAVNERADQVKQLLTSLKTKEALKASLQSPPLGNKDESVLNKNYETVLSVLKAFKTSEIEGALDDLDTSETFKKGGLGSIVRVMVDRKGI